MATHKERARGAVGTAIANGTLQRPSSCEVCGTTKGRLVWHHPEASYAEGRYLMNLIPLCSSCHRKVHGGSLPEPRSGAILRIHKPKVKPIGVVHFSLAPSLHDRALLLQRQREKEQPHRPGVPMAEVWREVVARGLDVLAPIPVATEVK